MDLVNQPFVSIVIPIRNEEKNLTQLIKSLNDLNYDKEKFEVIFADGMSTDNSKKLILSLKEKFSNLKIHIVDNKGINSAHGRNLGVKKAKGEIIAFTDGDCFVPNNWLLILLKNYLEKQNNFIVGFGGRNISPDTSNNFSKAVQFGLSTKLGSLGSTQGYVHKKPKLVESLANCNLLISKEIINQVGGYDPEFRTGQDAEINFRIRKLGKSFLFIPESYVYHKLRDTPLKYFKRMFQYGKARTKIMKKHPDSIKFYYVVPFIAIIFHLFLVTLIGMNLLHLVTIFIPFFFYYAILTLVAFNKVLKDKLEVKFIFLIPFVLLNQTVGYTLGMIYGLIS